MPVAANGRRTVELRTALASIGVVVSILVGVTVMVNFFGDKSEAIILRERRILELEQAVQEFPSRGEVQQLAVTVSTLNKNIEELRTLMKQFGISQDGLVPRRSYEDK